MYWLICGIPLVFVLLVVVVPALIGKWAEHQTSARHVLKMDKHE